MEVKQDVWIRVGVGIIAVDLPIRCELEPGVICGIHNADGLESWIEIELSLGVIFRVGIGISGVVRHGTRIW